MLLYIGSETLGKMADNLLEVKFNNGFIVYFDNKTNKPIHGLDLENNKIIFFASASGVGKNLDTAAKLEFNTHNNKLMQNAELALFYYQLFFTGNEETKNGDLKWLETCVCTGIKFDQTQSYNFKQSLAFLALKDAKKAFNIDAKTSDSETIKLINNMLSSWNSQVRVVDSLDLVPENAKKFFTSVTEFEINGKKHKNSIRFYSTINNFAVTRRGAVSFLKADVEKWDAIKADVMYLVLALRANKKWFDLVQKEFEPNTKFCHYAPFDTFFGMKIEDNQFVGDDWQGVYLSKLFTMNPEDVQVLVQELIDKLS